jgi:hypothetical protein
VAALLSASTLSCVAAPGKDPLTEPPPPAAVQSALKDAALRTGVAVDHLKVIAAERMTWLDGSLGCPDPDLMYTQQLVPGYRIRIEADGKTLDYHADTRGTLVLCPPERAVPATR